MTPRVPRLSSPHRCDSESAVDSQEERLREANTAILDMVADKKSMSEQLSSAIETLQVATKIKARNGETHIKPLFISESDSELSAGIQPNANPWFLETKWRAGSCAISATIFSYVVDCMTLVLSQALTPRHCDWLSCSGHRWWIG